MVAKISSNNSLFSTLLYNKKKLDEKEASLLKSHNVYENKEGSFSMSTTLMSFEPYLVANKKTEKPVFHVSLNPDPKDKLSDEQYQDLADRYMAEMGYGNQPYVVFKHTDIKRTHLHMVSIRVDQNGKKLDSNFENIRSMKVCRQLEQEFNLHSAVKGQRENIAPTKKIDYKAGDIKHQVGNITKSVMSSFHFQSFGEYRTLLEMFNLTVEEVKGEHKGKAYNGLMYSVIDESGQKVGVPFKASLFGKSVGYDALQTKFVQSKVAVEKGKIRENLRPIIANAMRQTDNQKDFNNLLLKNNISVVFRKNEQGRIYGVSFIDYQNKAILNGSRLGKEFSANVFEEKFKDSPVSYVNTINKEPDYNTSTHQEPNTPDSGIASLISFEQHGVDYETESFASQKEREEKVRQRKRRGRRM